MTPQIIWTPTAELTAALVARLADTARGAGIELYVTTNDGTHAAMALLAAADAQAYNDALADWLAQPAAREISRQEN